MKLTDMHVFDKARVVAKTLGIQVCLFVGLLVLVWGSQAFYGVIDTKKFPQAYTVGETANLSENDKGKLLVDSVTNQLRREMGFVFQDFNLLDTFSLEDNIYLPLDHERHRVQPLRAG